MSPLEGVASKEVRARGRLSPPQYKKEAKQMSNELVKQISYILYKADEEDVKVNALLKDESIWLTQKPMAELLDVNVPAVSKHLKNIYECRELDEASTISILETVQKKVENYQYKCYICIKYYRKCSYNPRLYKTGGFLC